ncbi:hypothetical protein [Novosphingobium pokkalii]|uniref:Uncharacterized protein n=1 Tax=Novosphingobium pokkalii TaxID=1770194 RepID=A0ABV7V2S1_9SPHN|nr:hypothetical protein [Novosphingobium pokkalii]GHC84684.1 hypothetical protein GCM10019060_04800 [Novosphingobium pokkalii]
MIALIAMALATGTAPDSAPALAAVKACDKQAMRAMATDEPHRRTQFAAAVYAEQRAIAQERATLLDAQIAGTPSSSGAATTANALAQIDARQKELDDVKAIEKSWRDLFDEVRADFLANCSSGKRNADDK